MKIKITAKNIVWDTDGEEVKLPKSASAEFAITHDDLDKRGLLIGEFDAMMSEWLSDTYGWCVNTFDMAWCEVPSVTHTAAMKFLKGEAAKVLEKAIAFRAKPECDASAWLKWLDKNINAKGYVLNFNSMTGEPIGISTQNLAFA